MEFLLLIIFTTLFILLFLRFGAELLIKRNRIIRSKNAAIVLLMGSIGDRSLGAFDLYSKGKAKKIIMAESFSPGVDILRERNIKVNSVSERSKIVLEELGVNEEDIIIIPGNTKNTMDEALAICKYLELISNEIDALILVTSKHHSFRSHIIFQQAFHKCDIHIYSAPTEYDTFTAKRWYRNRLNSKRVVTEYIKLIYFFLVEWKQLKNKGCNRQIRAK